MLSPGDSIRLKVWNNPAYDGDFVIAPDGGITHPRLRNVKVAGIPLAAAEANVRQFLIDSVVKDPRFAMEPLITVAVSGDVPRPLVFAVQPGTSIMQAIARAGGPNQFGNRRHVRVIRSERTGTQRIFYVNLENAADRLALSPVRSGDQIVVDRRVNFFRDRLVPAIGLIGSIASLGLLIDRVSREN